MKMTSKNCMASANLTPAMRRGAIEAIREFSTGGHPWPSARNIGGFTRSHVRQTLRRAIGARNRGARLARRVPADAAGRPGSSGRLIWLGDLTWRVRAYDKRLGL